MLNFGFPTFPKPYLKVHNDNAESAQNKEQQNLALVKEYVLANGG